MVMTAVASKISSQSVHHEDVERLPSALRLTPKAADPTPVIAGKVVLVCFPVLLPGEDGHVIPFGRYDLVASDQSASPGSASQKAVLVNRDHEVCIILSTQELSALAQDPDVEII